jgi:class 3 adenylate cyclase
MGADSEAYSREELEAIFKYALPPEDYSRVLALEPPLSTRIEERIVTSLFTDMRDATAAQKRLGLEESSSLIVGMLEAVREEAIARGGYVDKFVGDEAMILFGAPLPLPPAEQAKAACRTALAAIKRSANLGARIGAGFNTGIASLGCFAPRSRPMYTPMGDEVNIGARMEGYSKHTGDRPTIVAGATRDLIEGEFRTVYVESVAIGKDKEDRRTVDVYAVVGERSALDPVEKDFWDSYDEANAHLAAGRAREALAIIQRLAADKPGDSLFETALDRAQQAYAAGLGERFACAGDSGALAKELADAYSRVYGGAEAALVEPGIDGLWRFRPEAPFSSRELILSPEGESLVWLRGLARPSTLSGEGEETCGPCPEPLLSSGFAVAAPIRVKNELAAVLLFGPSPEEDLRPLAAIALSFAAPWVERRSAETQERYREKVDDAERLEEVNRELEAKSAALERALREIRDLNEGLEARVSEAARRLERASSLKRYLPPSVVEDIIEGRRDLAPRTERRRITVLFSDVRGFTEATDGLEPEELARLLDEYLSAMSGIAFAAGATIDKFRGDGMMLFFGAPDAVEAGEGARLCLRMAVSMCREVEKLRAKWFDAGYDWDLGVRMGVNTGYATVGEFGSGDRMDYTAVGTEVNLAARLEACCETDSILVSHSTWALVRDEFPCSYLGEVGVKGIHRPIKIYRVDWRSPEEAGLADTEAKKSCTI